MGKLETFGACAALLVPLTGRLVRLEPLTDEHESDLWQAAQDCVWSLMPVDAGASQVEFRRWFAIELERATAGSGAPFATVWHESGRAIGTTHYHEIRREHRRLEIGGTWLARPFWRSGANLEAKLLLLEHAFALGYQRGLRALTDGGGQTRHAVTHAAQTRIARPNRDLSSTVNQHRQLKGHQHKEGAS
jgi:RimJ/RimL family protein N-acetyltransferase